MCDLRAKLLQSLDKGDFRSLFMEGGCHFYALVLHDELALPLFYACDRECDELSHVFVMRDKVCYDYDGPKMLTSVAEKYAGWPDEPPRKIAAERIREELKKRGVDDLEERITKIARCEFTRRKCLYEQTPS